MFSVATILKPFPNFETIYSGLNPATEPIAIPGTRDRLAGTPGYDPNLLAATPTPIGSEVMIWLPRLTRPNYGQAVPDYYYQLVWRLRSLTEQTDDPERKLSASFGIRLQGEAQVPAADPAVDSEGPRFIVPAAIETVQALSNFQIINDPRGGSTGSLVVEKGAPGSTVSPEPATVDVNSAQYNTYGQPFWRAPVVNNYPGPIVAEPKQGRAGLLCQGYYPDQNGTAAGTDNDAGLLGGPQFNVLRTQALGDELLILLARSTSAGNWDFTNADRGLSIIFGTDAGTRAAIPGMGIYIFTGKSSV